MRIDAHVHTARCGHGTGCVAEYVAQARERGIDVITFTEHVPLPADLDPAREYAMPPEQWAEYVSEVKAARTDDVRVLLGAEADWLPGWNDHVRGFLQAADWDVVLGSVHFLDGWPFDSPAHAAEWETADVDAVWERYFEVLRDAASSGLFDVMAHPDLVKKFGYRPSVDPAEMFDATAELLSDTGLAVEVSTAGLRKPCAEIYPSEEFLHACRRHGVPVTTGSDAHAPSEVGFALDQAVELLRRVGYTEMVYFEKRRPREVAL